MSVQFPEPLTPTGAIFSPCQQYRYLLWRCWAPGQWLHCCCLNPSTADAVDNDPTVERLQRRAEQWGYGVLVVTNIFAFRATDPQVMRRAADPVGPENDAAILAAVNTCARTICGWGNHGAHRDRGAAVVELLRGQRLHCFRTTASGQPSHPLYLGYALEPVLWTPGLAAAQRCRPGKT